MNVSLSDGSAEPETEETCAMLQRKRRKRTIITPEQLLKMEELYKQEQWPGRDKKEELAREIEMSSHFVNIWFQNKRSRVKKLAQEEEEIKAMKSRVQESSQCDKKVLLGLAPKSDVRSNSSKAGNAAVATRQPVREIQSVMPAVGGLPVFTISTKNGSSSASSVLSSLPQLAVPLIPQNTIFATIPQSVCLKTRDQISSSPQMSTTSLLINANVIGNGTAQSIRPATIALRSAHPPKRFKSTTVKTSVLLSSSSTYSKDTLPPSASQQPTQHSTTLNSTPALAHDSPCKLKHTLASTQEATSNAPASTLLRCMTLMMALSELPCSIPKDSSGFDLAVCAALYGVKLEKGNVLTYNKQDGFHIGKVVRKSKKGKKKKKRKAGKKR